jgi:hypothetical protein
MKEIEIMGGFLDRSRCNGIETGAVLVFQFCNRVQCLRTATGNGAFSDVIRIPVAA